MFWSNCTTYLSKCHTGPWKGVDNQELEYLKGIAIQYVYSGWHDFIVGNNGSGPL